MDLRVIIALCLLCPLLPVFRVSISQSGLYSNVLIKDLRVLHTTPLSRITKYVLQDYLVPVGAALSGYFRTSPQQNFIAS